MVRYGEVSTLARRDRSLVGRDMVGLGKHRGFGFVGWGQMGFGLARRGEHCGRAGSGVAERDVIWQGTAWWEMLL
jgi:hypothetical protein